MGKKRQPIYKIVAADVRSPRDGKFIEAIGAYNPKTHPQTIEIDAERANYWLNVGAQPTDTVRSLLSKLGIILRRELISRGLPEELIEAEMKKWEEQKGYTPGFTGGTKLSLPEKSAAEVQGAASEEAPAAPAAKQPEKEEKPAQKAEEVKAEEVKPEPEAETAKAEAAPAEEKPAEAEAAEAPAAENTEEKADQPEEKPAEEPQSSEEGEAEKK